jgi:hypothetical protein
VILQQYLEHLAPHRRKAKTLSRTTGLGCGNTPAHTCAMIMLLKPQGVVRSIRLVRLTCHVITFRLSDV